MKSRRAVGESWSGGRIVCACVDVDSPAEGQLRLTAVQHWLQ